MTQGYDELEFDLPAALLRAVIDRLETIDAGKLTEKALKKIPEEQGIYALYLKGAKKPVYIGKTDSAAGLRHRLDRHAQKLLGRHNIRPGDVEFKAIRLFVFTAMDIESSLIGHLGGVKEILWNGSGFGSNDPGKERDTTKYKDEHWDYKYPIRLDKCYVPLSLGTHSIAEAMRNLKAGLPFNLRFERLGKGRNSFHPDFENSTLLITQEKPTTKEILELVIQALPTGWHATALPSHIIVYKNDKRNFPSGQIIAKS